MGELSTSSWESWSVKIAYWCIISLITILNNLVAQLAGGVGRSGGGGGEATVKPERHRLF